MTAGTEDKKKLALAIGLTVIAAGTLYVQFFSADSPPRPRRPAAAARPPANEAVATRKAPPRRTSSRARGSDFEPIWRRSRDDETFNPLEADPTLRTGLLAAVRAVEFDQVGRNLFQFAQRKKKLLQGPTREEVAEAEKRLAAAASDGRKKTSPAKKLASKPRAPRLSWKYYGYANRPGRSARRAFLLDGEDVLIGAEGEVLKKRYKIVRIGLTSIVIEDMQYRSEQTLPISVKPS